MLRKTAILVLVLQSFWFLSVAMGTQATDELTTKLHKRTANYSLVGFNFAEALIRVSSDFRIPMGFTWVNTPAARAEIPFAWKDTTVQEIIESIAKKQPGYHVDVGDALVHISPLGLIPDRQNFLKLRIARFEVQDDYIEVASWRLQALVTPRTYGATSIGATGDSKVNLDLKDSTVEDILDALAAASNRKIWIVTFAGDTGLTPTGFRRTMSLWSGRPAPDDEHASWDLLRWGDPMPRPAPPAK